MEIIKVIAVVVTYNRKELLKECLDAILAQTYPVSEMVLIDNASTDGTQDMLKKDGYLKNEKIRYVLMDTNSGGAGGFYEGIRRAKQLECRWVWVMDDDTVPELDCLEKLIAADELIESENPQKGLERANKPSFLASAIYGPNGEFMNVPVISSEDSPNGYAYWYKFLKDGIVSISSATFVSVLIKREAIETCGLPCMDYFIWGDDTEYTLRLTTFYGDGYFVGSSVAIHKRIGAQALRIEYENNPDRLDKFHYNYRNGMINKRYYDVGYHGMFIELARAIATAFKFLFIRPYGFRKAKVVLKGYFEYLFSYKKFENYINGEIKQS